MPEQKYKLARGFQLRSFFVAPNPTKNLFFYRQEAEEWLQTSEKTVAFLLQLKGVLDAANADEVHIREGRILARADLLANMILNDILCGIYGENCAAGATNNMGMIVGGGRMIGTAATQEAHKAEVKDEAKGAIKDVSIMSIPYKGLVRRVYKIAHNVEVIDRLIDERLYVPAALIRENITDMVFKGVWHGDTQALFNRIMKTFVLDRLWSRRGQEKKAEWDRIIAEARTVSDVPGRVFLQVVEQSLATTGIAA